MAAVERVLVAQGWHVPRWRTTNKDYGKFYKPQIHTHTPTDSLNILRHPSPLHHVVDYINCTDRCRPHHPTSLVVPSSLSSSFHITGTLAPPYVQSSNPPANNGVGLNSHIQHLTLQERVPVLCGPAEFPCLQKRLPHENHASSTLDERPPWRPKPLKPMILFEKKAKDLEKERSLDRLIPSYKRKKSEKWLQAPSPANKRQQIDNNISRAVHSMDTIHPATRRYSYYKYYGYGGQGAKTSWAHNRPLGQKPPFSKRTRDLQD